MIISVDFDGSLCTGFDFDIKNKIPNQQLIDQVNYLRSCGNYIKIVTARGAYKSTYEERHEKYYELIKEFLDSNGVQYDLISFNKEFADIYIDDLAIRPDEVIITKDLSSYFTNNIITRINDFVIKSGETAGHEYLWYEAYQDKEDIPHILNITRHSLIYNYIEADGVLNVNNLLITIDKYRKYPRLNDLQFDSYIVNICRHLDKSKYIATHMGNKLLNKLNALEIKPTFAHGDLSTQNIISNTNGLRLIDPLYGPEKFGSYILDYAKLLFSLKFYNNDWCTYEEVKTKVNLPFIEILIAAEAVRVASYRNQFNFIAENLINEL